MMYLILLSIWTFMNMNITFNMSFKYEPNKRLPVQSQQLEQCLKHVHI